VIPNLLEFYKELDELKNRILIDFGNSITEHEAKEEEKKAEKRKEKRFFFGLF
jgi:hypothetical protein